jgi:hypothetical protein
MDFSFIGKIFGCKSLVTFLLLMTIQGESGLGITILQTGTGKDPLQLTNSVVSRITAEDALERVKKSTHKMGLRLDFVTEINPDIATILSETRGVLSLDGLQAIDFDSAQALASNSALALRLNGLVSMTPQVASSLARVRYLEINKLQPSLDVVRELGNLSGTIELNAMEFLDAPSVKELAKNGYRLSLNGVKTISADVARELATSRAWISMNGLEELSVDVAAELSKHTGGWSLASLRTLVDTDLAKRLAEQPIGVQLPMLEDTSIGCLSVLANSTGPVQLGLQDLTTEQAQSLSSCNKRLTLPRIHRLQKESIDMLLKSPGGLDLPGLSELIDARLAERLAEDSDNMLSLLVESLSEPVAVAIARRNYILSLPKLRSLESPIARALAAHRGRLILSGLIEMSDEHAELFAARNASLYLSRDMVISDYARKKLESNKRITWRKSTSSIE